MTSKSLWKVFTVFAICLILWVAYELAFPAKKGPFYNGVSYNDDTTANMVTVVISTSPFKSMPDTKFLEESMSSLFRSSVLAKSKKIIVFDGLPPQDFAKKKNYDAYKQRVQRLTENDPYFKNTELVFMDHWGHLSGTLKEAMNHIDTPFIFVHQHDLKLIKDIDMNGVIATMVDNPNIKHLAFPGDSTNIPLWTLWNGPVDTVIEGVHYVPLRRTFGWTDRTHVARYDYYRDFVLPRCGHSFMEFSLLPALKQAINIQGFDEGHRPFGTYFFGEMDDDDYIIHTDARVN